MKDNPKARMMQKAANPSSAWLLPGANDWLDYWVDAWQRSILMLDVLRQRGNNCVEHNARKAPNVLSFDAELVLDGRSLPSNSSSWAAVLCLANTLKLVPPGTSVAPSGKLLPRWRQRPGAQSAFSSCKCQNIPWSRWRA